MGFDVLTNTDGTPAEIKQTSLVDARGFALEEAWLVETGSAAVGDHSTFPPPIGVIRAAQLSWERRQAIPGASTLPDVRYNLVLKLKAQSPRPSVEGIRLLYTADGTDHAWESKMGLEVRDVCS